MPSCAAIRASLQPLCWKPSGCIVALAHERLAHRRIKIVVRAGANHAELAAALVALKIPLCIKRAFYIDGLHFDAFRTIHARPRDSGLSTCALLASQPSLRCLSIDSIATGGSVQQHILRHSTMPQGHNASVTILRRIEASQARISTNTP